MNLKKIFLAAVIVYGLISAWLIGTPYINNAMFANDLDTVARILSVDGTIQKAKNQLLRSAGSNNIPVTEKDFTIIMDERTRQVLVEVVYTVQVKTPFDLYIHTWNFHPRAEKGLAKIPKPNQ